MSLQQVLDLVWRSKNLQHPSVVPVVGVMWALPGMSENIPVLVTECCELGSLTSVSVSLRACLLGICVGMHVMGDHS
eukprot:1161351-Pelagomonas_calceolata.AAC.4